MESDPAVNVFALPARVARQRLHGYVREHLQRIEQALSFGIPYASITEALHAAGFPDTSLHTIEQAVYRARHYKPRRVARPGPQLPFARAASLRARAPDARPSSMKEDMANIARRLRELARPPRPGEEDPLI